MHPAPQPSLYEQLLGLPEGLTGEILNGQLHTQPRPAGPHLRVGVSLGSKLHRHFDEGDGGPGGWWILLEPEVHFVRDVELAVPDIAGWRRERLSTLPTGHRFEVTPDWVCEILSPSTASKDREVKLPLYAHYQVGYAWLVDPLARHLEAYALHGGEWRLILEAVGEQTIEIPPFIGTPLAMGSLRS